MPERTAERPLVAAPAPGGWRAVAAHWLRRFRRTWVSTALAGFLTPLLYLVGMGYGLGLLVDQGSGGIDGVPYLWFVAPGVLATTAMQVAAGENTFSVMGAIKWERTYHGMLATPLGVRDVVAGHMAYTLVRLVLACVLFLGVAAALGTVRSWWGLLALPVAVLGGLAFAAPCYAYAARLESDRGLTLLFRFVVMPMSLFAGTFFPVSRLPDWLEPVAWATPLWHAVDACRALVLGTVESGPLLGHVAYLLAWFVVGYALAVHVLRRRMVV